MLWWWYHCVLLVSIHRSQVAQWELEVGAERWKRGEQKGEVEYRESWSRWSSARWRCVEMTEGNRPKYHGLNIFHVSNYSAIVGKTDRTIVCIYILPVWERQTSNNGILIVRDVCSRMDMNGAGWKWRVEIDQNHVSECHPCQQLWC